MDKSMAVSAQEQAYFISQQTQEHNDDNLAPHYLFFYRLSM